NEDQAIETPAQEYTELNYGGIVYSKTAVAFDYLMAYLGESMMDKCMQEYFKLWHFKHPQPADLKAVFENVSGKDLSWFFNDMINSTKKLDYKITSVHHNRDNTYNIGIKNVGSIKAPVIVQGIKDNKIVGELVYDGFTGKQSLSFPPANVDYFKIDYLEVSPDVNRNNNRIKAKGVFKKIEPLKIQFLGSIDNPDKTQLFWTPVAAWNNYNKWMFGVALYNNLLPQKKFEFELMPLYSHSTNDFSGYAHLMYNIFPNQTFFQKIAIGGTYSRYAYTNRIYDRNFNKYAPELFVEFKKSNLRAKFKSTLRYRNITIIADDYTSVLSGMDIDYIETKRKSVFNDLTYLLTKSDAVQPYSIALNVQHGGQKNYYTSAIIDEMTKVSVTAKYSYKYSKKNKSFDARLFAGTFVGTNKTNAGAYRFRLSGFRGYQDYMYDNVFLGRTETDGVLANQFVENEGAFKFYSPVGQSAEWLVALNLKSSLGNMKLPLCLYADIGTTGADGILNEGVLYNAGVCVSIVKNIFEVYFPVLISKDFENYKKANGIKYPETIRFTLNLNMINPFDLIRKFEL
ncbi:MAG: hypothetical protein JNL69_02225, partial [Bacteroidia bacterium]|nr:hypothetical protein [Bacteroidia bacterium]